MTQEQRPIDKAASPNGQPSGARKQSRMEEILRVIEEYASGYREFMKALRKKHFH
jgi:hypothetical protein